MAAGDILRGQYQGLSADPNSLANLDQGREQIQAAIPSTNPPLDLPNNLQRQVPIVSY